LPVFGPGRQHEGVPGQQALVAGLLGRVFARFATQYRRTALQPVALGDR
jgi:hypothetical protein